MALKTRKEMDTAYQWDLSHIFPTVEAWEKAYTEAEEAIESIAPIRGTLGDSAASLKAGLDTLYAAAQKWNWCISMLLWISTVIMAMLPLRPEKAAP